MQALKCQLLCSIGRSTDSHLLESEFWKYSCKIFEIFSFNIISHCGTLLFQYYFFRKEFSQALETCSCGGSEVRGWTAIDRSSGARWDAGFHTGVGLGARQEGAASAPDAEDIGEGSGVQSGRSQFSARTNWLCYTRPKRSPESLG